MRSDPPADLPAHALRGADPDLPDGFNRQLVSLYTSHQLDEVRVVGVSVPAESQIELGWNVYSVFAAVGPGDEVNVEFDMRGRAVPDSYRLVLDAQPTFRPDTLRIDVRLGDEQLVGVETTGTRNIEMVAGNQPG
ncbi:MAG: hypothetical protein ACLFWR_13105 [Acidimicrobiales bacterium]